MTEYTVEKSEPRVIANSNEVNSWVFCLSATDTETGAKVQLDGKHICDGEPKRIMFWEDTDISVCLHKWMEKHDIKIRLDEMLANKPTSITLTDLYTDNLKGVTV